MRVSPEELQRTVASGLKRAYAVIGEEPLLIRESVDCIRRAARENGYADREVYSVDSKFDWFELARARVSMGLFAQRKLIELHCAIAKFNADGQAALAEHFGALPDDQILLIRVDTLDATARKESWYAQAERAGVVIDCAPVPTAKLPAWIAKRFQAAGFKPSNDAIELLAERSEGNLLAADQEIEKLKLIQEGGAVSVETIDALMSDQARFDVYRLLQLTLSANVAQALRVALSLERENFAAPLVVWAFAEPIRQLLKLAEFKSRGVDFDAACERIGVYSARRPQLRPAATRLGLARIRACLTQIAKLERISKGHAAGDFWRELHSLIAAIGVRDGAKLLLPA